MPSISYVTGETAILWATFYGEDGDAADPGSVTCTLRAPSGATSSVAVTNPSVGTYRAEVDTSSLAVGRYRYEFAATGGSAEDTVTSPRYFYVEPDLSEDTDEAAASTKTPSTGREPYCTPIEFLLHVDSNFVGQLVSDDRRRRTVEELQQNGVLLELLKRASGRIEASCLRGRMYDASDLHNLMEAGGNAAAYLRGLCADVVVGYLRDRRVIDDTSPLPAVQRAERDLRDLADGVQIFAFTETADAGTPSGEFLNRADLRRVNLLTLEPRYWGSRTREGRPTFGY